MRHKLHQENPEGVNANGYCDGIYYGGKKDGGWVAVKQLANAEISVNTCRERQDGGREFQGGFEAIYALG